MTGTLQWISESDLQKAVEQLIERAEQAKIEADKRMKANVVDPFSSLVVSSTFGLDSREGLVSTQQMASGLHGISNALGDFHHQVLSSVAGWANHDAGYDIENTDLKILAEIKNKHNTMSSTTRKGTLDRIATALELKRGREWKAYLVIIVPKKPKRYRKQIHLSSSMFEIDGSSFYEGVTGDPNALHDLFMATLEMLNSNGRGVPDSVAAYCQEVFDVSMPPSGALGKVEL